MKMMMTLLAAQRNNNIKRVVIPTPESTNEKLQIEWIYTLDIRIHAYVVCNKNIFSHSCSCFPLDFLFRRQNWVKNECVNVTTIQKHIMLRM